ncbi:MAG: DUF3267 domain-containing protein [Bacillus sp. (in: firmicutes)]
MGDYVEDRMDNGVKVTVDPVRLNVEAILYTLLLAGIVSVVYVAIWGFNADTWSTSFWSVYMKCVIGCLVGLVIHEFVHALGFVYVGKAKWSDIKFGIIWKYLAPYAHCKIPITIGAYRVALLLPVIVTGIVPLIIGLAIGSGWLTAAGVVLTVGGIGDWAIFRKIRPFPADSLLQDHPSEIGCIIYNRKECK